MGRSRPLDLGIRQISVWAVPPTGCWVFKSPLWVSVQFQLCEVMTVTVWPGFCDDKWINVHQGLATEPGHTTTTAYGDYCALAIIIMEKAKRGLSVQNGDTVSGIPRSALQQTRLWGCAWDTEQSFSSSAASSEVDSTLSWSRGVSRPAYQLYERTPPGHWRGKKHAPLIQAQVSSANSRT